MTHASEELIAAMAGECPHLSMTAVNQQHVTCACDGTSNDLLAVQAWIREALGDGRVVRIEDKRKVACPACRALFPDAIKVRHDYIEERTGVRP